MSRKSLYQLYAEHTGKSSDKWSLYLSEYDRLFSAYRDDSIRLLEIGVQNGGSLDIWSKYFENASSLIGCDVDPACANLDYDDARIRVVIGDANAADTREQVLDFCPTFDIIIDDGSHLSGDIVKSFAYYFPRLAEGGLFVVEDLHCSYWSRFDGGLFDPYSSITFFKRLADVLNHEHWGVERPRSDVLRGILAKYGCEIDATVLPQVHSVEFINSMCVVRKSAPDDNGLGYRFVVGTNESVVSGHQELRGSRYALPPFLDQRDNPWTVMDTPPDEAFLPLRALATELEAKVSGLNLIVSERDGQASGLVADVAGRDLQFAGLKGDVALVAMRIASLTDDVAARDLQVASLQGDVALLESTSASLTGELAGRDLQIAGLNSHAADLEAQIASLADDLAGRDDRIVALMRDAVEREERSLELHKEFADRGLQLVRLRREVAELYGKVSGLNADVVERDARTSEMSSVLAERDLQVAYLNAVVAEREAQVAGLNRLVVAHQQSTSWRITQPLRSMVTSFRSARSRLRQAVSLSPAATKPADAVAAGSRTAGGLRDVLLRRGYGFYRRHLKATRLGRALAAHILRRGLVSPAEIQIAAFAQDPIPAPQDSAAPATREAPRAVPDPVEVDFSVHGFHLSPPLNLQVSDALSAHRKINVLLPSVRLKHMSGGPNTALLLAALLAERGERIRLIACDAPADGEEAAIFPHMEALVQRPVSRTSIEVVDAFDRTRPTSIGANDLFLATAWWTAQMAKYAVKKTVHKAFIYLIQDFEPILHEGSTFQARALETYGLEHIPVINTRLLRDHLAREGAGFYANPEFAARALWFEPALDRNYYFADAEGSAESGKKVLLFYARPTVARRNLFEIGVVALRQAVASGAIDKDHWEVWAMGERLPSMALGNGVFLNPLPWMSFDDYARRVRTADLMLSLMLSPHPSYPPLEMAASGKLVVTNSFSVKTAERMKALSPNIIVAEPTAESIGAALENAAGRLNAGLASHDPTGVMQLPSTWDESMSGVVPELLRRIQDVRAAPGLPDALPARGLPSQPQSAYENYRRECLARRRREGRPVDEPGLLSFVTSAYNTDPVFLEELATSMFSQDGGMQFEWLILDNGSTNKRTETTLQQIAAHAGVRLERVESNLGIIGGMRYLLERARGRYILPLDSDDLIEPDCVQVVTRFIKDNDYPPLIYTDEDKFDSGRFGGPYFKPGWDPVLFLHSCFIAHLCAIDREKALELDLYTDVGAEGCHDWDSFIRFMNRGHVPAHLPEVLYSWRIHSGSTSGNIASKSYITESHRNTLQRFLDHSNVPNIDLVNSPLFAYDVDWWFKRRHVDPQSMYSIVIGRASAPRASDPSEEGSSPLFLDAADGIETLATLVRQLDSELIHLSRQGVAPDDADWRWDAMALLELFPDAVMVGGSLHDGTRIVDGPRVFGFGDGFDSPDAGRPLSDPGYGAKMWKPHTVSSIPVAHCVIRADFLARCIPQLVEERVSIDMLGPWLGALASESGKRVVYSPFMRARFDAAREAPPLEARSHFLSRFWRQVPDTRVYSPRLGLDPAKRYEEVDPAENRAHRERLQALLLPYPEWLEMRLRQRVEAYPLPDQPASMTLITTVYEGTNVELLDALAASVLGQTVKPAQWVIVVHGPLAPANVNRIVLRGEGHWQATVVVEPSPLGIMGAMRRGLDHARGDYIVPVDADDVLTPDAIQILIHAVHKYGSPDLIYSDEDMLVKDNPASPYLRSAFDPVLNLDSSYIWHLCAIARERAVALGLYTDPSATWCHDWDSVLHVSNAGGRIEHVPEVLYHWRQHPSSTTNNTQGDSRSLDSVRHVLERQIARTPHPEHFVVADWPVHRGARELYIARRPEALPPFVWIADAADGPSGFSDDAVLVVAANGVLIESQQAFSEVARLFELHPRLGAAGGLVANKDGTVIDACNMVNREGMLESPWLGHASSDGGSYALALKTQTVATTGRWLAFFRVSALRDAGIWPVQSHALIGDEIMRLCGELIAHDWTIAFSPLIRARAEMIGHGMRTGMRTALPVDTGALVQYGAARSFRM